jgi:hypothetical protein
MRQRQVTQQEKTNLGLWGGRTKRGNLRKVQRNIRAISFHIKPDNDQTAFDGWWYN